jgi:GNAT superfamily N-acetyltransferase
MKITTVDEREYAELLHIWECCYLDINPRANNKDVFEQKNRLGSSVIGNLDLRCIRSITSKIIGFIGIYHDSIELFCVLPSHRLIGVGGALLRYATDEALVKHITHHRFRIMNECFY